LANVLTDGHGWGSFSIGLATFGDLDFLPCSWLKGSAGCWGQYQQSGAYVAAATFEQITKGH
jgi:hypothetical protein